MQYLDSGRREAGETLGSWIVEQLGDQVNELRLQSGFFNAAPLGLLDSCLHSLGEAGGVTRIVLGSNDPGTLADDVRKLLNLMQLPREDAALGVVRFGNAFFHPKTFHIRRADGSQAAYVGSANFTAQGLSLHVEAGIVADTRKGDPSDVLSAIASAVDQWFDETRAGIHLIKTEEDIRDLVERGILALAPPTRPSPPTPRTGSDDNSDGGESAPRLRSLVPLPAFAKFEFTGALPGTQSHEPAVTPTSAVVQRPGFPAFIAFAPDHSGPTSGIQALTGHPLPEGAEGLVIRLSRDDTRLFSGGAGTANINLPNETMQTIRFGILGRGRYPKRPRAEFDLHARYVGEISSFVLDEPADTNVMVYGYLPDESGHRNNRMLLPGDVRTLSAKIERNGTPLPAARDFAFLEWPTTQRPDFRVTFLQRGTNLAGRAEAVFNTASAAQQLVGSGACWLLSGIAPAW